MNFQFSSDEQAFAHEVREFLRDRRGRNVEFTQADVASFFDLPTIPAGLLLGQMVLRGLVEAMADRRSPFCDDLGRDGNPICIRLWRQGLSQTGEARA